MKEVNPKETTRAYAFEFWMRAPMPMVTFFKTLDVTPQGARRIVQELGLREMTGRGRFRAWGVV